MSLLNEKGIEFEYHDYKKDPLSQAEIRRILKALGQKAGDLLRRNDKACKEAGLDGTENESELIRLMASYPGLLQRPIGISDKGTALGRPIENLLAIV